MSENFQGGCSILYTGFCRSPEIVPAPESHRNVFTLALSRSWRSITFGRSLNFQGAYNKRFLVKRKAPMKLNKGYSNPFEFRLHTALGRFSACRGTAPLARFKVALFNCAYDYRTNALFCQWLKNVCILMQS